MRYLVPTRAPFSFAQTLAFIRRFPPNHGEYVLREHSLTAAIANDNRAVAFTLEDTAGGLVLDADTDVTAPVAAWLGANDDLAPFYTAARGDAAMQRIIRELHGLHHVAFMTLAEIAVYCVMMQRQPITNAARMKARFLDAFGWRAGALRTMPALAQLATLDGDDIGRAIRHRTKGPAIARVVRGVAALGETFLRTAPYATARDALLAIPGVGPFSAGAILLRGLGRMDEVPTDVAADEARALYGRYDKPAITRRYGSQIGYWAFYAKTGIARAM